MCNIRDMTSTTFLGSACHGYRWPSSTRPIRHLKLSCHPSPFLISSYPSAIHRRGISPWALSRALGLSFKGFPMASVESFFSQGLVQGFSSTSRSVSSLGLWHGSSFASGVEMNSGIHLAMPGLSRNARVPIGHLATAQHSNVLSTAFFGAPQSLSSSTFVCLSSSGQLGLWRARRRSQRVRCSSSSPSQSEPAAASKEAAASEEAPLNAPDAVEVENGAAARPLYPEYDIAKEYVKLKGWEMFKVQLKMLTAWPWQRVKKGSVLSMRLSGPVSEQLGSQFSSTLSLPQICENLKKAAVDPRISALFLKVDPLQCGWGKIEEIRRHIHFFQLSGKPCMAYISVGGEKEFYLASACSELYTTPGAYLSLRGLTIQGQFLGGVLKKVGVLPEVKRIGKYKSAGEQLRCDKMPEPVREMLTAILEDLWQTWLETSASHRGKSVEEFEALLDAGVLGVEQLKDGGWITDIKYEDELEAMLKKRTGAREDKPLRAVNYRKYSRVSSWTLGLSGGTKIAVIRAVGAIRQGKARSASGGVASESFIQRIREVKDNSQYKAVVLRIDSPGGDALASDLMWHELRLLAEKKPVVASMVDVAASGGYYMAMGTSAIVAEPLTLTGSIGVVIAKFVLQELYQRVGFNAEYIARGRYALIEAENKPLTPEEDEMFNKMVEIAYKSFRDKAALSRGLSVEDMEEVAQGRVWTGKAALQRGLVDALGGIGTAIAIAKEKAGIPADSKVRLVELTRQQPSLATLLSRGTSAMTMMLSMYSPEGRKAAVRTLVRDVVLSEGLEALSSSTPQALMDDIWISGSNDTAAEGALSVAPEGALLLDMARKFLGSSQV